MKKDIYPPVWMLVVILPFLSFQAPVKMERPWKVQNYLTKYRYLAVELNQKEGIPIPIIFAVAGLESDWGTSELAVKSNNHFGIKATDWAGSSHCKYTYEYLNGDWLQLMDCFRKYTFIKDSYVDFGTFLRTRSNYDFLFRIPQDNLEAWAYGLWYCNYATDPEYSEKLLELIEKYQLDTVAKQ
ncbi:MAG: glucosaminidase domain-containing protein [Saprospirales bacterium]|nr:glucosaminidase domain-containing protein [Saprospirales bacterium]